MLEPFCPQTALALIELNDSKANEGIQPKNNQCPPKGRH